MVLIVLIAFGALYQSLRQLSGEVESLREELQREAAKDVERSRELNAIASSLEQLSKRIEGVEESLKRAASAAELRALAEEVGRARAELSIMRASIAAVNRSLLEQTDKAVKRLDELKKEIDSLAERLLFPAKVVDGAGDTITIMKRPARIVTLAPSATETVFFVGAFDRVVGTDQFSNFPSIIRQKVERKEIIIVGGFVNPSVEKILEAKPDVVIGVTNRAHIALKDILAQYRIPVVVLPQSNLSDVLRGTIIVGEVTGNLVEAYEMATKMKVAASFALALSNQVKERPKIASVVWTQPIYAVGGGSWQHDVLSIVGTNVYADLRGWPVVSPESFLARKPDVIVATGSHGAGREAVINVLRSALGDSVGEIPAIARDRVFETQGSYNDAYVRPSPRTFMSLYVLMVAVHPYLFNVTAVSLVLSPENLDVQRAVEKKVPEEAMVLIRMSLER
ncbi:MAG: helical backbone metal receptor [Acidilobaceae archaeon]|nr:helical backbone metal receptor [Acidilobaceae archaeon]MDW7973820.1 helical backbone metal receptor [Sulfolobales archaeon]